MRVQAQSSVTLTVTSASPVRPSDVAVIVAVPTATATTRPCAFTATADGLLLAQLMAAAGSTCPCALRAWALKATVSPGASA